MRAREPGMKRRGVRGRAGLLAATLALTAAAPAQATLRAVVEPDPFRIKVVDGAGRSVLEEVAGGGLHLRAGGIDHRATKLVAERRDGDVYTATVATADPAGRTLHLRIEPAGDGVLRIAATVEGGGAEQVGTAFTARDGERYLGFGERSNAVDQRGNERRELRRRGPVPGRSSSRSSPRSCPLPGYRPRDDATYFPMPWLLSTRGYGVLVENDERIRSRPQLRTATRWAVADRGATLRARASSPGPRPADVLRRFSADVGRQPPADAPWFFGPWWQPTRRRRRRTSRRCARPTRSSRSPRPTCTTCRAATRRAGARRSASAPRASTRAGLAVTTYFNPMICTTYPRLRRRGGRGRADQERARPALRPTATRARRSFFVGQFDFTAPGRADVLRRACSPRRSTTATTAGWRTSASTRRWTPSAPTARRASRCTTATSTRYHARRARVREVRAAPAGALHPLRLDGHRRELADRLGRRPDDGLGLRRPRARRSRNGADDGPQRRRRCGARTSAASSPWRTTADDARAARALDAVRRGLSASCAPRPTASAAAVDRGRRSSTPTSCPSGAATRSCARSCYPYLHAADSEYQRTGMPIMRHHALDLPGRRAGAVARDDQYLFGPDLLAAPVLRPGRGASAALYLPRGRRWIDLWRSALDAPDGVAGPERRAACSHGGARARPCPRRSRSCRCSCAPARSCRCCRPTSYTLTEYGGDAVVNLSDRANRRQLLAWPASGTWKGALGPGGESLTSRPSKHGWALRIRAKRPRIYDLQAWLGGLPRTLRPCRVRAGSKAIPRRKWRYDRAAKVLTASFRAPRRVTLRVERCAASRARSR